MRPRLRAGRRAEENHRARSVQLHRIWIEEFGAGVKKLRLKLVGRWSLVLGPWSLVVGPWRTTKDERPTIQADVSTKARPVCFVLVNSSFRIDASTLH